MKHPIFKGIHSEMKVEEITWEWVFHRRSGGQSFAIADRKECIAEEAFRYTPAAETNAMHILPATTARKGMLCVTKENLQPREKLRLWQKNAYPTPALNDIVALLGNCFNWKHTIFITTMQNL